MSDYIKIENLDKRFGGLGKKSRQIEVLHNFNLTVGNGEFLTLFGPNACGKSTLLNIIAGLVKPDKGSVLIGSTPNDQARIGFVFQSYHNSLLPWRTNLENVALPLDLLGFSKRARLQKTRELLNEIDIKIPEDDYPYQLSGGQQQLLCIARALISNPDVLLMDEPFNQLDYQTRMVMNEKIQEIWEKTGKTIIFVSHDLDEALLLADRMVLLTKQPARIAQIVTNNIPRPRKMTILQDERFFQLRSQSLKVFERVLSE